MKSKLNEQLNSVQVLNFGRSGFDLADMYAYQTVFVDGYNPDITIFFVSAEDLVCQQSDPLIPKVIYDKATENSSVPFMYGDLSAPILNNLVEDKTIVIVDRDKGNDVYREITTLNLQQNFSYFKAENAFDDLRSSGIEPDYWEATGKFGHWNASAHHALGKALAKHLLQIIVVK